MAIPLGRRQRLPYGLCRLLFLLLCCSASRHSHAAEPAWIDPFGGWAGPTGGMLYARVHRGKPLPKPQPAESSWKRLEQTVAALERNAIANATVGISGLKGVSSATANEHGFIALPLPAGLPEGPLPVELTISTAGYQSPATALLIQVWADQPGLGVIADIDDTMIDTGVTSKAKMLLGTFFHSAYEVRVFPGAATVVSALSASQAGKPSRCLFFLSGSPWGLHERLSDAFDRALVPQRVTILRSYSREPIDSYQFKRPHLEQLVSALPQRRWLLLGDSGEKDPEVYAQLRRDHPGQIEHIYIHNVTNADPNDPRFAAMTLFQQWSEVERDLQQRGYRAALPPAPTVTPTAK